MSEDKHGHHNHHALMAADFKKRFWVSMAITVPILVLSPLLQDFFNLRDQLAFRCPYPL